MKARKSPKIPGLALVALAALLSSGCLQLEMTVQMQEDGSATITERVRFTRKLMELDRANAADKQLARWLERNAAEERLKEMGKGVTLASHKVATLPDGSRESVAVYQIPDVEDLRLVNPLLQQASPARLMAFRFQPIYKVVNSYEALGELLLTLVPAGKGGAFEPDTSAVTPLDLQVYRELQPMFMDMMEDLEIRLDLVATKNISHGHVRGRSAGSKTITFMSFTDKDLDAYGGNEELMLSLLQYKLNAENITDHTQNFAHNGTLPVFLGNKPYGAGLFRVKPTKRMFDKYFAGRPKSEGGDK